MMPIGPEKCRIFGFPGLTRLERDHYTRRVDGSPARGIERESGAGFDVFLDVSDTNSGAAPATVIGESLPHLATGLFTGKAGKA